MDSHIANFHIPYLKWFKDQGYEVHVASNRMEQTKEILYCDFKHQIDFVRTPFSLKNRKPYQQMKELFKETPICTYSCSHTDGCIDYKTCCKKK